MRQVWGSVLLGSALSLTASAATIPHAGRLLDASDAPVTGTVSLRFRLHSAGIGGTALWESNACPVSVRGGSYSVSVGGDCAGSAPLTDALLDPTQPRFLEVSVEGVDLAPRLSLNSVPSAVQSRDAQALIARLAATGTLNAASNPVSWTQLKDVPAGFADGTDGSIEYQAGAGLSLTGTQFAVSPGGVQSPMLADGAVTLSKLSTEVTGALTPADGSVSTTKLAANAVNSSKLAADAASLSKLSGGKIALDAGGTLTITGAVLQGASLGGTLSNVTLSNPTLSNPTVTGTLTADSAVFAGGVKLGTTSTCDAASAGTLRFVSASKRIEYCDGSGWASMTPAPNGSSQSQAALSCNAVYTASPASPNGTYWVDPNGGDTGDAYQAYCVFSGGSSFTLLLTALGDSAAWGTQMALWTDTSANTSPTLTADFKSRAYNELVTNTIRLCYGDFSRCYDFPHNMSRTLRSFFVDGVSYVRYSYDSSGYSNTGSSSYLTDYQNALGWTVGMNTCQWLGINDTKSISKIGFLSDANGGCASIGGTFGYHDDGALGLGLQSCLDSNSCTAGGPTNVAGEARAVTGQGSHSLPGTWFVLGK